MRTRARHRRDSPSIARRTVWVWAGPALALLGGCGLFRSGAYSPIDVEYARALPEGLTQEQTLDIQVFRDGTRLELTNTTARSFGEATLWVNRRFGLPIDRFDIGQTLDVPLARFVDQYGVPFRAGGFFATEPPDPVVLVQLEHDGFLHGLVITGNRIR